MNWAITIVYIQKNPTLRCDHRRPDLESVKCRQIIGKNKYSSIISVILVTCLLLVGVSFSFSSQNSAFAQTVQTQPQAEEEGQEEQADEGAESGEEGEDQSPGLSRLNRPTQSDAPVASQEWAKSDFTGFIDTRQRLGQPDAALLEKGLRILTTDDFPPFNSRDEDGLPRGYHVELVRALCEELSLPCTLKIADFSQIPDLIAAGEADIAVAGIANHPALQEKLSFPDVYLQRPARFARLKDNADPFDARALDGLPIAVRGGTAHEAFLRAYFPEINRGPVTDLEAAKRLVRDKKVLALFGDAFSILADVSDPDSALAFAGKPYYDAHFIGDGMAIALGLDQVKMRNLLNYGFAQTGAKRTHARIVRPPLRFGCLCDLLERILEKCARFSDKDTCQNNDLMHFENRRFLDQSALKRQGSAIAKWQQDRPEKLARLLGLILIEADCHAIVAFVRLSDIGAKHPIPKSTD